MGARAPELMNPLDVAVKAQNLKSLYAQNKAQEKSLQDEEDYKSSVLKNTIAGPDGKPTIDQKAVLSDLYKKNPLKGMETEQKFTAMNKAQEEQKYKETENHIKMWHDLVYSAHDPESYAQMIAQAHSLGLPGIDAISPVYPGDKGMDDMRRHVSTSAEQIQQKDFDIKRGDVAEKHVANVAAAKEKTDAKDSALIDKYTQNFKKDWDPDASRTGNFGKISATKIQADKLVGLVNQYPDHNLDSRQTEELALGLANMLSGSSGAARSQVEALVPHTLLGKMKNVKEWIMNNPYGAEQQAFVNRMLETVHRERDVATQQMNDIRARRIPFHAELQKKLGPERWNALLKSDPEFDPANVVNGRYAMPGAKTANNLKPTHEMSNEELLKELGE